jgi:large subunit ribosomal protein L32
MGPLPKRKLSKGRSARRRSHLALQPAQMVICPQCHSPKLPHHACPVCGTYNGREVIKVEGKKKEAS